LALGSGVCSSPDSGGFSVASPCHSCTIGQVTDGNHEALACGVVASGTGIVGAAKPVVRGIKEPLEHHWVRHAGEVPLCIPVRGRGGQLAGEPWYDSLLVVAMRF
jgi:hypothetical protein